MPFDLIILPSVGSASVAVLALFMAILQLLFFFKKTELTWFAWSAAICFSAMVYSVGIFIEYNTPQGPLNRFSGLLEFTALIFLVHSVFGFSFSYLGIESRHYHPVAGMFHTLVLVCLWSTDWIVSQTFVAWQFMGLNAPYVEPGLGPLGPVFVLYTALAGCTAVVIWIRFKRVNLRYRRAYLTGMGIWLLLGIHDGMTALGIPTFLYIMEYGFLAFAIAIWWVVFNSFVENTAEEQYGIITEFANDCILVVQDGKIVFGNPAFGNLVGMKTDDSALEEFLNRMAPTDRDKILFHHRELLNGGRGSRSHTVSIRRTDGEQRFVEIVASHIRYWNRPAVLAIMRDMTERVLEEEARQESQKKMARLKKMESLGILAGGVAHDLNNVLSGIVTYPDLILPDLPPESKLRKPIETMQKSGQRAAAIVQDLLTLARRGVETKEVVNLNDIVSEYLATPEYTKTMSFHAGISLQTRLEPDLLNVVGSFVHLSKTIMNLVANAAEAMPNGGQITIQTANRYIDRPFKGYAHMEEGDYTVLKISDTGMGVSSEEKERIFEPFYTKKVMGRSGTGLGMSVVWGTVQDHHGYIDIDSTQGKGTTFTIYLPATRKKPPGRSSLVPLHAYAGNGEKILAVDDVESQREIITALLTRLGYDAVAVSSGEAAISHMKKSRVDLLVLDMIMDPGMDGLDTYRQILNSHPGQKAIIASGFSETGRVKEALKLGAGAYVQKPYTLEKIGSAVRNELDK